MLLAAAAQPTRRRAGRPVRGARRATAARAAFKLADEARRAGLRAQLELAGRSLKGQLKHADRIGARYVAIVERRADAACKDMETGEQRESTPAGGDPASCAESG